jgi:hypothetical protein
MTEVNRVFLREAGGDSAALDAGRIRQKLAAGYNVNFDCFNNIEADEIAELLTEEERGRVAFHWVRDVATHQTKTPKRRFAAVFDDDPPPWVG